MNVSVNDMIVDRLPGMRSYARSLTRNAESANDLVHDAIVRVISSFDRFDGSSFAAWSNTILHNRFIDGRRRARFHGGSIDDLPSARWAQEPEQYSVVELDETLCAVEGLSPVSREILELICVKGVDYADAAVVLDIPLGTVRSRLSRARGALIQALELGGGRTQTVEGHLKIAASGGCKEANAA